MRSLRLAGTDIDTSVVGFGCAGLFRLPTSSERRVVLDAAYAAGLRHYDTAPMYGLGRAEPELADLLRRHREEITVTTKFGIDPTPLGRGMGRLQMPVRAVLQRSPKLGGELKSSGRGPSSGWVGGLLYASVPPSAQSAATSLHRSLRALGTDYVDVFELHDPTGGTTDLSDLCDYLDGQRELGRIRCWGITGANVDFPGVPAQLRERSPLLQYRSDVFDPPTGAGAGTSRPRITFGILERALPLVRRFFAQFPDEARQWSDRLGLGGPDGPELPDLLLRDALRQNSSGPVLFSTTRVERVQAAARAAEVMAARQDGGEPDQLGQLVARVRAAFPDLGRPT